MLFVLLLQPDAAITNKITELHWSSIRSCLQIWCRTMNHWDLFATRAFSTAFSSLSGGGTLTGASNHAKLAKKSKKCYNSKSCFTICSTCFPNKIMGIFICTRYVKYKSDFLGAWDLEWEKQMVNVTRWNSKAFIRTLFIGYVPKLETHLSIPRSNI